MALTKDKTIDGKVYWKDDTKYYMEYSVQGGIDTGLMQIARDRLKTQKLYTKELYKDILWLDKGIPTVIRNKDQINKGQMLLLPVDAPAAPVSDSFTLSEDMNVRTSKDTTDSKNLIYAAGSKTPFTYDKSSLVTDAIGRVWAKVIFTPPYKDKAGKAYPEGWICVKEGTTFYTAEKIDVPVVKTPKG